MMVNRNIIVERLNFTNFLKYLDFTNIESLSTIQTQLRKSTLYQLQTIIPILSRNKVSITYLASYKHKILSTIEIKAYLNNRMCMYIHKPLILNSDDLISNQSINYNLINHIINDKYLDPLTWLIEFKPTNQDILIPVAELGFSQISSSSTWTVSTQSISDDFDYSSISWKYITNFDIDELNSFIARSLPSNIRPFVNITKENIYTNLLDKSIILCSENGNKHNIISVLLYELDEIGGYYYKIYTDVAFDERLKTSLPCMLNYLARNNNSVKFQVMFNKITEQILFEAGFIQSTQSVLFARSKSIRLKNTKAQYSPKLLDSLVDTLFPKESPLPSPVKQFQL